MKQCIGVVGCGSQEESVVDAAFFCSDGEFLAQGFGGGGLRFGVRHVEDGGDTACCGGSALAFHVGFVSQSRIAKMYVFVHNARDEVASFCIDDGICGDA